MNNEQNKNKNDNNNINKTTNRDELTQEEIEEFSKIPQKSLQNIILEEKKRRYNIITKTEVKRNPQCYFLQNMSQMDELVDKYSEKHYYILSENDEEHTKYIKYLIDKNKNNNDIKEIKELTNLNEKPITIRGDVFFIFPDKYILRGTFNLSELRIKLFDFVREYIKKPNETFNLYNINENKMIIENKINLLSSKYNFPLVTKVSFPVIYCKLQENKLNKLTIKTF
jgi:hypothetical protein